MKYGKNSLLYQTKKILKNIARDSKLLEEEIMVLVKPLTPEEAIGEPLRRDFPIIEGVERVIEADFLGIKAHAFTDAPVDFKGKVSEILDIPLTTNSNRALYIATMNAILKYLGKISQTIHCKDEDPEMCSDHIAQEIFDKYGQIKIGLIGLNPAIAEKLIAKFGKDNVGITDLNKKKIGILKNGVLIQDGKKDMENLVQKSDLMVITGTTFVNDTFDDIYRTIERYSKKYLIYGVTSAGICYLMKLNRICPYGRE